MTTQATFNYRVDGFDAIQVHTRGITASFFVRNAQQLARTCAATGTPTGLLRRVANPI